MRPKYEQLADELRAAISALEPGTRLPSVRRLVRDRGVSQFTVVRAFDLLEQQGYLTRRSALGTFRAHGGHGTAGTLTRRVLVMSVSICNAEFNSILCDVLVRRGYLARIHYFDLREPPQRWLPRIRCDGILFLAACPPHALEVFRRQGVPLICQGIQYSHLEVDCTYGDERLVGALAARHLVELGHRRLAVLYNEPHLPDGDERVRGFVNQARLAGLEPRVLDCHAELQCNSRETARQMMHAVIERGELDFTGLFSITDNGATGAMHALYRAGVAVPERVSIVGCDNRPETAYLCPALTTIEFNHEDRVNGLIDLLEQRLAGDDTPRLQRVYEPALIIRQSTAAPPQ